MLVYMAQPIAVEVGCDAVADDHHVLREVTSFGSFNAPEVRLHQVLEAVDTAAIGFVGLWRWLRGCFMLCLPAPKVCPLRCKPHILLLLCYGERSAVSLKA